MFPREQNDDCSIEQMSDRRESPRTAFHLSVRVTISPPRGRETDTARFTHVLSHDVSGGGISLIYTSPLGLGQKIELEMPDRWRSATVCRIASMDDGHYLIGCQFTD
jgi:hypothetical protein